MSSVAYQTQGQKQHGLSRKKILHCQVWVHYRMTEWGAAGGSRTHLSLIQFSEVCWCYFGGLRTEQMSVI